MIYLDNAATTKMAPKVVEEMLPFFTQHYGNAGSIYRLGAESKKRISKAREIIARTLSCKSEEIFFTSGGTESDNWALKAVAEACSDKGKHIITSKIEHHAILHTCKYLEEKGFEITYLDVDRDGLVDLKELKAAIRPDTILISIMFANNEIGTIEPIAEIGSLAREKGIIFHTDAVQAYGHLPINVEEMQIDLLSASGHKFNGPKGVGFLYIRKEVMIRSFMHGGAQERNRRAGTENVPGIVGMAAAAELSCMDMESKIKKVTDVRDYLIDRIEKEIPYCHLNGHRTKRLPGNVNFTFRFIEGETLLILLDGQDICASSGSACSSGSIDPSHVLLAIGTESRDTHGALRMTLSEENTVEEMDFVVDKLKEIITRLRSMSPEYKKNVSDLE